MQIHYNSHSLKNFWSTLIAFFCFFMSIFVFLPEFVHAEDGILANTPDPNAFQHQLFIPLIENSPNLRNIALQTVAIRSSLPLETLQIVDTVEVAFTTLGREVNIFSITSNLSEDGYSVALDSNGAEMDPALLEADEAAAYASLGDYEVYFESDEFSEEVPIDDGLEGAALGSNFVPYVSKKHEYRVSSSSSKCLSGGLISLKLTPVNNRSSSAKLRVTLAKCDGSAFTKGGKWYIRVDGVRRFEFTVSAGKRSFVQEISPLAEKWYDTKTLHTYQIELISSGENTSKYTGKVNAEVWGQCWCTDYVYQKRRLNVTTYPDAWDWGKNLTRNGYRALNTMGTNPPDLPQIGDIVVMQKNSSGAGSAGHIGIIHEFNSATWKFTLLQGGSTPGTIEDGYCYNIRTQDFAASIKNNSGVTVYRK